MSPGVPPSPPAPEPAAPEASSAPAARHRTRTLRRAQLHVAGPCGLALARPPWQQWVWRHRRSPCGWRQGRPNVGAAHSPRAPMAASPWKAHSGRGRPVLPSNWRRIGHHPSRQPWCVRNPSGSPSCGRGCRHFNSCSGNSVSTLPSTSRKWLRLGDRGQTQEQGQSSTRAWLTSHGTKTTPQQHEPATQLDVEHQSHSHRGVNMHVPQPRVRMNHNVWSPSRLQQQSCAEEGFWAFMMRLAEQTQTR